MPGTAWWAKLTFAKKHKEKNGHNRIAVNQMSPGKQTLGFGAAYLLCAAFSAAAMDNLDIVGISRQFVLASYAASRCSKPTPETLSKHMFNFGMVTMRASQELARRYPESSQQQIAERLRANFQRTEKVIDAIIRSKGCDDPRIQDLLKRFEIQADLKL